MAGPGEGSGGGEAEERKKALPGGGAARWSQQRTSGLDACAVDATAQLAAEAEGHTGTEDGEGTGHFGALLEAVLEGIDLPSIGVVAIADIHDGRSSFDEVSIFNTVLTDQNNWTVAIREAVGGFQELVRTARKRVDCAVQINRREKLVGIGDGYFVVQGEGRNIGDWFEIQVEEVVSAEDVKLNPLFR